MAISSRSTPPTEPLTPKPKVNLFLALLALIVGGTLQGVFSNVGRVTGETGWRGFGTLLGVVLFGWVARRLRWWLVLVIPASLFAISIIATPFERATMPAVRSVVYQVWNPACEGWENLGPRFDAIGVKMESFVEDLTTTKDPDVDDARRWVAAAQDIRGLFQLLAANPHPPILDQYLATSVELMTTYANGFTLIINGNVEEGQALLDEGDTVLLPRAQAEFSAASAKCGG